MAIPRMALVGATVGVLGAAACGGSDDGAAGAPVSLVDASAIAEVRVEDNRFEPEELEVAAGTTVRFSNAGRNEHNVVPSDGVVATLAVDVADLGPGSRAERRLTEPGTYDYYCSLHGTATAGMHATIVVTG